MIMEGIMTCNCNLVPSKPTESHSSTQLKRWLDNLEKGLTLRFHDVTFSQNKVIYCTKRIDKFTQAAIKNVRKVLVL
jgi:hypothetical protein